MNTSEAEVKHSGVFLILLAGDNKSFMRDCFVPLTTCAKHVKYINKLYKICAIQQTLEIGVRK
jgi:hypothetical protein